MSRIELIASVSDHVVGRIPWNIKVGHGFAITMEFGAPKLDNPDQGEWHFWVSACDWVLDDGTGSVITDTRLGLACETELLKVLGARTLSGFSIQDNRACLEFSNGWRLSTRPYEDDMDWPEDETEQLLVFTPGRNIAVLMANGRVQWEKMGKENAA